MKKTLMLMALVASVNAYGGSIDYLAQQDAEYFAHPSMIGKIGTSGAFYNQQEQYLWKMELILK